MTADGDGVVDGEPGRDRRILKCRGSSGECMLVKVSKAERTQLHRRRLGSVERSSKGDVKGVEGERSSHELDIRDKGANGGQALELELP